MSASSRWLNPRFEKLLGNAQREQNHAKRAWLFKRLENLVVKQRPWFPLVFAASYLLRRSEVGGMKISLGYSELDLRGAFLKP